MSDTQPQENADTPSVTLHDEELLVETREVEAGSLRARKRVDSERVQRTEPRLVEHGDFERVAPLENDSGEIETLEDGSISIPLFEERLVVSKQVFVRERVVLRKRKVIEHQVFETELRTERWTSRGSRVRRTPKHLPPARCYEPGTQPRQHDEPSSLPPRVRSSAR